MKKPTMDNRYWGAMPRPESKAKFFNAVTTPAQVGGGSIATIRLYGPIDSWGGYWGVSAKDVGQVLDAIPDSVDQIVLRINSPGGEVWEAIAILNMFRAHKATVLAVVDGLAASAASVIASGCDETVMSPGTQMMIHSPSGLTWGNARDLRKDAEVLDSIEASLISIYEAKAGKKDWTALLEAETWLTAIEATEFGLADRVAVIPDAGEAETVGDDPVVIVEIDGDEVEDVLARATPIRERAAAIATRARNQKPTHQPPSSSEPVEPNRKDVSMSDSTLADGLRERLGITDADASEETLLAALDEQLDVVTAPPAPTAVAPGTTLIDSEALTTLQADAAQGRLARDEQNTARRQGIVDTALSEGRIAPAQSAQWIAQLAKDEAGATALIQSLPKNTVTPVVELGHSDDVLTEDDRLMASAGWAEKKEA